MLILLFCQNSFVWSLLITIKLPKVVKVVSYNPLPLNFAKWIRIVLYVKGDDALFNFIREEEGIKCEGESEMTEEMGFRMC